MGQPGAHGLADGLNGERCGDGDFGGKTVSRHPHLPFFDHPVAEADPGGLLPGNASTGEEELECTLLADDGRKGDGQSETVVKPEPGEVGRETGLGATHPEVGRAGQTESPSDRCPLHGGDHRGEAV